MGLESDSILLLKRSCLCQDFQLKVGDKSLRYLLLLSFLGKEGR